MQRRLLILLIGLLAPVAASSCSSDADDAEASLLVVDGAPLAIIGPALVSGPDGTSAVIGTLSNATERTVEVVAVESTTGEIAFRTHNGEALSTITIQPDSEYTLHLDGTWLELSELSSDIQTVEVILDLDIDDQLTFEAQRQPEDGP